jgi:hypothetical protein
MIRQTDAVTHLNRKQLIPMSYKSQLIEHADLIREFSRSLSLTFCLGAVDI